MLHLHHYLFHCVLLLLQVLTLSSCLKHSSISTWERITDILRLSVTLLCDHFTGSKPTFKFTLSLTSSNYWINTLLDPWAEFVFLVLVLIDLLLQIIQFWTSLEERLHHRLQPLKTQPLTWTTRPLPKCCLMAEGGV